MYVTSPILPDREEFFAMINSLWDTHRLTNGGEYHAALERALAEYLGVPYISLFANGTLPLMVALRALGLERGEIITTPYSFVATAHAAEWSGFRPVFADIEPHDCTLSVESVRRLITERTRAIMPVHVYGGVCDVEGFEALGREYGLPVIYDGAHAFGVRYRGKSVYEWGDMATLSFHATKVFNTLEGGALVCRSAQMKQRIDRLKNFGFAGETSVVGIGINGKMDELRSAWGLLTLRGVDAAIQRRRELCQAYREALSDVEGIRLLPLSRDTEPNYAYMPIFVEDAYGETRDALYERMKGAGVYGRRYFYPLITAFEPYAQYLTQQPQADIAQARQASEQVICLPLYPAMSYEELMQVVRIIKRK